MKKKPIKKKPENRKPELTIEEQAHRTRLRDLYCGIFVVTVFVWVLRFALGGLASLAADSLNYYAGTALELLAEAVAVFLPFFVFLKARRDPLTPIFRESPRSEHPVVRSVLGILAAAGLTLCAMGLTDWFLSFLEGQGVHSAITVPDLGNTWQESLFYIVLSTVLYSFVYEVSFRGIALRTMEEENRTAAVLVSGLAYALCDGDPYHIVVRLAVGFVLGWFYIRIRSVWACVVLQAASQVTMSLWWLFIRNREFTAYINFLILMGIVLGIAAAFFLFFPRRNPDAETTSNKIALQQVFTSFGVYLLAGLVAFNMLVFTFSTDADPADPLLQPTPEEDQIPPLQFNRDEEFEDYYGTLDPEINE